MIKVEKGLRKIIDNNTAIANKIITKFLSPTFLSNLNNSYDKRYNGL